MWVLSLFGAFLKDRCSDVSVIYIYMGFKAFWKVLVADLLFMLVLRDFLIIVCEFAAKHMGFKALGK